MTDLFSKLETLQDEQPTTVHIYIPLTVPQFKTMESQIYRMEQVGPPLLFADGHPVGTYQLGMA